MSGVTVGWDETAPADARNLGLGAGDIRSKLTNIRGGLDAEHLWPSGGGYSGIHRAGSARAFYGTASAVSSTDTDGRLMYASDTSVLFGVNSATTVPLGGRYTVFSHHSYGIEGTNRTSLVTQRLKVERGEALMVTASASTTVTFATTNFVFAPHIQITPLVGSVASWADLPGLTGFGATTLTITNFKLTSGASGVPAANYWVQYTAYGHIPA